jgi:hypothetical protein
MTAKVWTKNQTLTSFKFQPNFESYADTIPISFYIQTKLAHLDQTKIYQVSLSTTITHPSGKFSKFETLSLAVI